MSDRAKATSVYHHPRLRQPKREGGRATKERIFQSARKHFFTRSYNEVRLTDVARDADSNVALVNYYFGSKEHLFREIFRAESETLATRRRARLSALTEGGGAVTLEGIVRAWVDPVIDHVIEENNRILFKNIMAMSLGSDSSELIKSAVTESIAIVDMDYVEAIRSVRPDLSVKTIYWRMLSALGAYTFVLGDPELIDLYNHGGACDWRDGEEIRRQACSVVVAVLSAPEPTGR